MPILSKYQFIKTNISYNNTVIKTNRTSGSSNDHSCCSSRATLVVLVEVVVEIILVVVVAVGNRSSSCGDGRSNTSSMFDPSIYLNNEVVMFLDTPKSHG